MFTSIEQVVSVQYSYLLLQLMIHILECKCRLNESVCNSKQKWNLDECRCGCKELDDFSSCKDEYMWNSSTCDGECNYSIK